MAEIARSHRGCPTSRGCGCFTDKTLQVLEDAERKLFSLELDSYASADNHGGYAHYKNPEFNAGSDVQEEEAAAAPTPVVQDVTK